MKIESPQPLFLKDPRKSAASSGVALLMVLWVMMILSAVAMEFSFAMRIEANLTKNYRDELQLYALAEGGIQRGILEMILKHDPKIQQWRRGQRSEEIPAEQREWVSDGREYKIPLEKGEVRVRVIGEGGKININLVSEATLRRIIGNLGLEGEERDTIVDSILDWRDPDDFYRLNGAENDYYQSLPEPYQCKNGNLDSIEELLLIKGVRPALFYGKRIQEEGSDEEKGEKIGLRDIFSIYASGEQIDLNSAALPVLKVVLGIPFSVARQIIAAREERPLESFQDLQQRVPEIVPFLANMQRQAVFRATIPYYTIEAKARLQEGGLTRGIKAIVKVDGREKNYYKVIQWMDAIF